MASGKGGHGDHVPIGGDRRALVLSGLLTGVYFVIELGLGLWSGSVAVVSDAFHTFSAVGGVLIALVAQRLSEHQQRRSTRSAGVAPRSSARCLTACFSRSWRPTYCGWTWTLASGRNLLSAHIRVHNFTHDGKQVLHRASDTLKKRFRIYFSTLQVEEECASAESDAREIGITRRPGQRNHDH